MQTIELRYFASVREAIGKSAESRTTRARTLAELRDELCALGEPYATALSEKRRVRAAVNQEMALDDAPLGAAGSTRVEVAFFPPVTGG